MTRNKQFDRLIFILPVENANFKTSGYLVYVNMAIPWQGPLLHVSILVPDPSHCFPPCLASFIIVLADVLFPLPHGSEHSVQLP